MVDLRADIPGHWEQFLTTCVLAGVPVFHLIQARERLTGRGVRFIGSADLV